MTENNIPIKARADRLSRARRMANLSRKSICIDSGININTLKGWELARHGGLTQNGADKIVARLQQAGVLCHAEWLMHGTGSPPVIRYEQPSDLPETLISNEPADEEQAKINLELALFEQHHQPILYTQVGQPYPLLNYQENDLLAGKITDTIARCVGQYCLVLLASNKIILGKVIDITDDILTLNTLAETESPQYVGPYQACAIICWHRKHV